MAKPNEAGLVLVLQLLAGMTLVGWWLTLTPATRLLRLGAVMVEEHVLTVPPAGLLDQADWLVTHRRQSLPGMLGLVAVAACVGLGEGIARRQRAVFGGFLLRSWTLGKLALVLLPGAVGGYLVAPWPLPVVVVSLGLALFSGAMMYFLLAGAPYSP